MILVTGATGTVGSRVLRELLGLGAPVCAGVHARPLEVEGVEAHAIDFDRPETLPTALEGVEAAFLASYATRHEQALVPAAVHTGVERIVKLSAWQADREEFVVGRWHREVERAIKRSGLAWTFLRPNSYMQNVVTVMGETIRNEGAIYDSVGDARISHVDTRDVAATAARVLTEPGHDGRTYELSGPETLTHHDLAATLTRVLGRPIRYVPIDDEAYRHGCLQAGMANWEADAYVDLNRYYRTGKASAVTDGVRQLTGREPGSVEAYCRDIASQLDAARPASTRPGPLGAHG